MQAELLNRKDDLKRFVQEVQKGHLNPDVFSYQVKNFGKETDTNT